MQVLLQQQQPSIMDSSSPYTSSDSRCSSNAAAAVSDAYAHTRSSAASDDPIGRGATAATAYDMFEFECIMEPRICAHCQCAGEKDDVFLGCRTKISSTCNDSAGGGGGGLVLSHSGMTFYRHVRCTSPG